MRCFCANDDGSFACQSNSTCEVWNGYCFSSLEIIYDEQDRPIDLRRSAGCLYNNESGLLLCKTKLARLNYTCCKGEDLCNEAAYSAKTDFRTMINGLEGSNGWTTSFLLVLSIVLLFVTASLILASICQSKRQQSRRKRNRCECMENNLLFVGDLEELRMEERKLDAHSTRKRRLSGHLTGPESITEKSQLFNELAFQSELSNGRFLSKHRARRHGLDVFVKIYKGEQTKHLWANEVNIYKIILIRHENILNFVAKSEFYDPQLDQIHYLTVTGYHRLGSLASFLSSGPSLSESQMLGLMLSASSGLNHLHLEISSNQRKASIVHRNVNAKNFIVKQNLTCALANFNYAIKSTELDSIDCECDAGRPRTSLKAADEASCEKICKGSAQDAQENKRSEKPCKRCKNLAICKIVADPLVYCPPEYLDNSINLRSIVSLKSADTYSFGLVLWQMANYFYTGAYREPFCQDRHARSYEASHHKDVSGSGFGDSRNAPRDEEPVAGAKTEKAKTERAKTKGTSTENARTATHNAELKRLKYLLLKRNPSDELSIEAMFACDGPSDERPSSSPSNCLRSTKPGLMIDEADGLKANLNASEAKRTFEAGQIDEASEVKEIDEGTAFAIGQPHLSTKSELCRIIKESTYIEPLSRLSIRKIESDLNRLLQQ